MTLQQFQKALDGVAAACLGAKETVNNRKWTKQTDLLVKYMSMVPGWAPDAPYCAAAVGGAILYVLEQNGLHDAAVKFRKFYTASCMENCDRAKKLGILSKTPTPYAIMIFQNGTKWTGHEAMVQPKVWEGDRVATWEGNTNAAGSREGDGIYPKTRVDGSNGTLIVRGYVSLESILRKLGVLTASEAPKPGKADQAADYSSPDVVGIATYLRCNGVSESDILYAVTKIPGKYNADHGETEGLKTDIEKWLKSR